MVTETSSFPYLLRRFRNCNICHVLHWYASLVKVLLKLGLTGLHIWAHLGSLWAHIRSFWIYLRSFKLALFRPILAYLSSFRLVWDHLGSFSLFWTFLGLFEHFYGYLDSIMLIWVRSTTANNYGKNQTFQLPPIIYVVLGHAVQETWGQQHWNCGKGDFFRIWLCDAEKKCFC